MFYIAWFISAWIAWLKFADKTRWREIFPVCIFAMCLALATDVLMFYYPLWEYVGPPHLIHLADDMAIYPVVTYLFIQWLPDSGTVKGMIMYWLIWSTIALSIELIYVNFGYMQYYLWWSTWHSYAADWLLYWLFYQFHCILRLEKLSSNK